MSDKSGIEWTEATPTVDRGGRRVRYYRRKRTDRPGSQERKRMAAQGMRWCRGCKAWLAAAVVLRQGACQVCTNAEDRKRYATSSSFREGRKAHRDRRSRGVDRVPLEAQELLAEFFEGECAYCDARATTWDHVDAVNRGGATAPGNILPACRSCNSRKKAKNIETWLNQAPSVKTITLEYLAQMRAFDGG